MKTQIAFAQDLRDQLTSRAPQRREGPLSVAVLVDTIAAHYGGPAYSVRRLWQSALDLEVQITVQSTDGFRVRETAADHARWQPLDCHSWPPIGIKGLGYARNMSASVESYLRDGASVISQHGLWLQYGRVARNLGKTRSVPVIIHTHGMLEPWALARSRWKKWIAGRLWEHENLRRAHCLRVTSEDELKSVRNFGLKNPVALIPNGIDVSDFENLPARKEAEGFLPELKDKRVLLFLSRVHPKKGLPQLLQAWRKIGNERRDWLLAIAGPDQLGHLDDLKRLVGEMDLKDSVRFTGALFGPEKLAAYALADLFVLPSYSENFGVAIAEALSAGVPVIATKGTPWRGLKKHRCGWWIENDVETFAETLREALSSPERDLVAMGARGKQWMTNDFTWERLATDMIAVCDWTLGRSAPPSCIAFD
jgi:glycosyltransferase involved in cell wall biosynthesis